jgi:hypothetical protein
MQSTESECRNEEVDFHGRGVKIPRRLTGG